MLHETMGPSDTVAFCDAIRRDRDLRRIEFAAQIGVAMVGAEEDLATAQRAFASLTRAARGQAYLVDLAGEIVRLRQQLNLYVDSLVVAATEEIVTREAGYTAADGASPAAAADIQRWSARREALTHAATIFLAARGSGLRRTWTDLAAALRGVAALHILPERNRRGE
jgi:hypothetical protein